MSIEHLDLELRKQELITACVEDFGEPCRTGCAKFWPDNFVGVVPPGRINFDRWHNCIDQGTTDPCSGPYVLVGHVTAHTYRGYWLCLRTHAEAQRLVEKQKRAQDQYYDSRLRNRGNKAAALMIAPKSIRKKCIGP